MSTEKTAHLRGMSDPFPFSFDVLDKGRKMLVHAVIFTSYEVWADSDRVMEFPTTKKDPRMEGFVNYVWANFLKERRAELDAKVKELETTLAKERTSVAALDQRIKQIDKELNK